MTLKGIRKEITSAVSNNSLMGWLFVVIGLVTAYWPITKISFQQDEWHNFGYHIFELSNRTFFEWLVTLLSRPLSLTQVFNVVNYELFGIQTTFSAIQVMLFVVINIFVWTHLVEVLGGKRWVGVASGVFASLSFASIQSIEWVYVAAPIHITWFVMMLSVLQMKKSVSEETGIIWVRFIGAVLLAVVALSFKFHSVFMFGLLFVVFLGWTPFVKFQLSLKRKGIWQLGLVFLFGIVSLAGVYFFFKDHPRLVLSDKVLLSQILIPLQSIGQLVIDYPPVFYELSEEVTTRYYKLPLNHNVSYQPVVGVMSLVVTGLTLLSFWLLEMALPSKKDRKVLFFGLLLFLGALFPYGFDVFSTGWPILESRYYHPAVFGLMLILFTYLDHILSWFTSAAPKYKNIGLLCVVWLLGVWLGTRYQLISERLELVSAYTTARLTFLEELAAAEPQNENGLILFLNEENYPITELKNVTGMSFQTGVLYPLVVMMADEGRLSPEFLADDTLWDLYYQGVESKADQRVGIFYDADTLRQHLASYPEDESLMVTINVDYAGLNQPGFEPTVQEQFLWATYTFKTGIEPAMLYEKDFKINQ